MITVGDHTIMPVLDSVVRLEPGRLFPSVAAEDWDGHEGHLTMDGRVELFLGSYVISTGDRLVLIDAGVGPDSFQAPSGATVPGGQLVDNLRVLGLHPESFTDVVLTHLHADHIGWTSRGGRATFPNATYRCHRDDWAYFVDGGDDDIPRQLLEPVASRFEMWDAAVTLFAGFDIAPAPGHTPGSSIVVLSGDGGERAMLLGDVVHCPIELIDDEWSCIGDVDPQLARTTRERLARELEGSDTLVGAAHFPELRFGRLLLGEPGRRWHPVGPVGSSW